MLGNDGYKTYFCVLLKYNFIYTLRVENILRIIMISIIFEEEKN